MLVVATATAVDAVAVDIATDVFVVDAVAAVLVVVVAFLPLLVWMVTLSPKDFN